MNTITTDQNDSSRRWSRAQFWVIGGLVAIGLVMLGRSPWAATGTLVPALYQTVLDANGNPVSGAKICTYLSGTSTPVATFTDVNLSVPNSNPIVADSAGRWSAFLTAGVSYKFVLQDGSGTVGVCNGATIRTIDTVAAVPGAANPTVAVNTADLRLTLTAGVPVTTADVTAATTVYATPYQGNRIALYDGTQWNLRTLTETAIPVPATTATVYDVFAVDTLTVPTFETLAWTNDTTRATALGLQDGVLIRSGQVTRRYIGSFRTGTVAGQTEDSATKRYVWNYAHRIDRPLLRVEAVTTWTYTLATWRQANGNAANQVEILQGVAESPLWLQLTASGVNSSVNLFMNFGLGEDSTTAPLATSVGYFQMAAANAAASGVAMLGKVPTVGRHTYVWLEAAQAGGTATWFGSLLTIGGGTASPGLQGRWPG